MRKRVFWLVISAITVISAPALAERGGSVAAARRHYTEGQALFNAGSYQAALAEFRAANDIAPHPITIKSQAECLERMGRIHDAVEMFEQYLVAAPGAADAAEIRARIASHQSRPGRLRVQSNPPGATVTLDGAQVAGVTPLDLEVASGQHAVAIQAAGYQMAVEEFNMPFAGYHTVDVTLRGGGQQASQATTQQPLGTMPTQPQTSRWRLTTPVWVMLGLTAAGLVTGIVTGALALADQGEFDDQLTLEGHTASNHSQLVEISDGGTTKALVADISFAVAGAAAITGIILFFVQNRSRGAATATGRRSPFTIAPSLALDGGGLSAIGRF